MASCSIRPLGLSIPCGQVYGYMGMQNEEILETSAAKGLDEYLQRMQERPSWQATKYSEQTIVDGWKKKLSSMKEQQ